MIIGTILLLCTLGAQSKIGEKLVKFMEGKFYTEMEGSL